MRSGKKRAVVALVLAAAGAGALVGGAMAMGSEGTGAPLTRAEVYHDGMTLKEVQAAATGKIGEVAPPCPDEATVAKLKTAGLPFGPCDPVPEKGSPVIIPDPRFERPEPGPNDDVCPGATLGKGVGLTVFVPCAPGAELTDVEAVQVNGIYCARVSYVARTGATPRTETVCPGEESSAEGVSVVSPETGEHAHE